jgi:hypothetical protein
VSRSPGQRGFIPPTIPTAAAASAVETSAVALPVAESSTTEPTVMGINTITPACFILVAGLIGLCIWFNDGVYHASAFKYLFLAVALAAVGVWAAPLRLPARFGRLGPAMIAFIAAITLAGQLFLHFVHLTNISETQSVLTPGVPAPNFEPYAYTELGQVAVPLRIWFTLLPFYGSLAIAGVLAGAGLMSRSRLGRLTFLMLLVLWVILGAWIIWMTPHPMIDVFDFQRDSSIALGHGTNPYAITFKDPYEGRSPWYGPGLSVNGRLMFGYPYFPLPLMWVAPAQWIAGDVRYGHLAALTIAAILLGFSRGRSATAAVFGAVALLLFTPRIFLVLEESWTEPVVILFLSLLLFCTHRYPKLWPYAFGLLMASKQYVPLTAPLALLLLPWPLKWRDIWSAGWRAAAAAAVVTLPLAVWNFPAFWHSTIALQVSQPFRPDALSFLSWWVGPFNPTAPLPAHPPSAAWGFVMLAVGIGLSLWRCPRTPAGFFAAMALSFLLFFSFNKQAFANYYFLVIGASVCAIVADAPECLAPQPT